MANIPPVHSNGSILIVEDDLHQAVNLEMLLLLGGHSICGIASGGAQAVSLAETKRPEIVVMSVNLSGPSDGIETAERIRAVDPCGFIFITGFTDGATTARDRPGTTATA